MANRFLWWLPTLEERFTWHVQVKTILYLAWLSFILGVFNIYMSSPCNVADNQEDTEDSRSEEDETEESNRSHSPPNCLGAEARSPQGDSEATDDDSEEVLDTREKFLIFTMGSRTYTPHQIGKIKSLLFTWSNYFISATINLRQV